MSDVEKNDLKKRIEKNFQQNHLEVIIPESSGLGVVNSDVISVDVCADNNSDTGVANDGFVDEDIASWKWQDVQHERCSYLTKVCPTLTDSPID